MATSSLVSALLTSALLAALGLAGWIFLADRLQESLVEPVTVQGKEVTVGATIGKVIVDDLMLDARTALHPADIAMYRSEGTSPVRG